MEIIRGIVNKVINKSKYTNSAKFVLVCTDLSSSITCFGRIDTLFKGITLELCGNFISDNEFEFSDSSIISIPDLNENKKATRMLLLNEPFAFTPRESSKIYKKFEKDTIKTILEDPEQLLGVEGIEVVKALDIIDFLKKDKLLSELSLFLENYLVPTSYISKIYNFYGKNSLHFLKTQPVKCGLDGAIPLNIARYLSKRQFLPISSNDNLTALIIEAIDHFESGGHTYVEAEELLEFLVKHTQIKEKQSFKYAMQYAYRNGFIKFIEFDGKFLVFKTSTYNNEQYIADNIIRIRGQSSIDFNMNYEIGLVEKSVGFKYSKEQVQAIKTAFKNTFSIITGPAGCGKTSVLTCITKIFKKKFSSNVLLCAPTGKAATRMTETTGMSAYTVHRALNMKPVFENGEIFNSDVILKYDLIIMDEASMLDNDLASIFFRAIKQGAKVILLGDPNQLPSVGCGNILQDILETELVPATRLTTVFRQGETSSIIVNANKIINEETDFVIDDNFVFVQETSPEQISVKAIQTYINYSNKINVDNLILLSPYREKTINGCNHLNAILEPYQNPKFLPQWPTKKGIFKVGDLVIRTQNDNKLDICNGSIGVISEIVYNQSFVVDFDFGKTLTYPLSEFQNFDLAYANTVHKSQGSEYDTVIIICSPDHSSMLNNKILYTAVTRAKNKVIIIGDMDTFKKSVHKKYDIVRNTMLKSRLVLADKLS